MTVTLITNARVVLATEVLRGSVLVRDGAIAEVQPGRSNLPAALDFEGDYLLPGLIELHTDNLEKHLEPRPGVRWPAMSALLTHDAQIASSGITTVLDAMGVGDFDERSIRAQGLQAAVEALVQARADRVLRADHLLHMRCELACDNTLEVVTPFLDDPTVRLVSLMDHTPGQRQWMDVEKFRIYTQRNQRWSDEYLEQVVRERQQMQERNAARNREDVLELCRRKGIPLASHDDTTPEHILEAVEAGVVISEFPTTVLAALTACERGLGVVMGAPNLVRGGSHSGNVSALTLAQDDLLDCLSSDYVPHALLHGAFLLRDQAGWALPKAVAAVGTNPARLVGLADRGEIAVGKRADLVRVRETQGIPVPLASWRQGVRIA
jgi:alpha-D-ribose 1-methylphosphonate 5-triphosphate diphosphatase